MGCASVYYGFCYSDSLTGIADDVRLLLLTRSLYAIVDQELRQRLEDLTALRLHSHNDTGSEASEAKEVSAVKATVAGDEKMIPDSDQKPTGGPVEDVRTEFVLQSVGLLAKLEEDLMALVRNRGKDYGNIDCLPWNQRVK